MRTAEQSVAAGMQHHQAGRLDQAEAFYRQALAADPRHAVALHQLGALALDAGRPDAALEMFESAVRADPSQATYRANLAVCYRQLNRVQDAERSLQEAISLDPRLPALHTMLGTLLQGEGRLDEAAEHFWRALEAAPNSADAQFDLGSALQLSGKIDQATACYQAALRLDANHVLAHINLGTIRRRQGAPDEALRHLQRALTLEPTNGAALTNIGAAYEDLGRTSEALAAHRSAVAADPNSFTAQCNLGALLLKLAQTDEALACFQRGLELNNRYLLAYHGLASALYAQGKLNEALAALNQAAQIAPGDAQAYLNASRMLNEQGRRDEAIQHARRALELDPNLPGAHGNLAVALHLEGRVADALEHHRREVELNPRSSISHSNLLYSLNYNSAFTPQEIFDEHRAWAARHADPLTAASPPHPNDRSPGRRLRIGYVSPHFFGHAVNFFLDPILASHHHGEFEVFCYSDVLIEDETTGRLRGYADHWRSVRGQGHEEVSRLVREDQIDILVDLTGHIGENRMLVFARKPAPIQVTYLGYQNTTGMQAMDYRLSDAYADPPGETERWHTEQLVRLPQTFFCYQPSHDAPPVGQPPVLLRGAVTFGSFNNLAKVTPEVLATWAEILRLVPGSRLVLLGDMNESVERQLRETFTGHGIGADRLDLVRRLARPQYLELIASVDVALDPFPFNGHTTTCDCLWQGVPVVTLSGNTYVSRFGGSGLATLGLHELIAHSKEEYQQIALGLACDLERLKELRATMRETMRRSPLMDYAAFTQNLEAEYRRMWQAWCASQATE